MASPIPIYSQTQNVTGGGYSSPINVSQYTYLIVMVNLITITGGGGVTFGLDIVDAFGNKYDVADIPTPITANNIQKTFSVGPGLANNVSFPDTVTLHWFLTGTAPTANFQLSLIGK